jgi:hypothetical protein
MNELHPVPAQDERAIARLIDDPESPQDPPAWTPAVARQVQDSRHVHEWLSRSLDPQRRDFVTRTVAAQRRARVRRRWWIAAALLAAAAAAAAVAAWWLRPDPELPGIRIVGTGQVHIDAQAQDLGDGVRLAGVRRIANDRAADILVPDGPRFALAPGSLVVCDTIGRHLDLAQGRVVAALGGATSAWTARVGGFQVASPRAVVTLAHLGSPAVFVVDGVAMVTAEGRGLRLGAGYGVAEPGLWPAMLWSPAGALATSSARDAERSGWQASRQTRLAWGPTGASITAALPSTGTPDLRCVRIGTIPLRVSLGVHTTHLHWRQHITCTMRPADGPAGKDGPRVAEVRLTADKLHWSASQHADQAAVLTGLAAPLRQHWAIEVLPWTSRLLIDGREIGRGSHDAPAGTALTIACAVWSGLDGAADPAIPADAQVRFGPVRWETGAPAHLAHTGH